MPLLGSYRELWQTIQMQKNGVPWTERLKMCRRAELAGKYTD
jgi:hypothetical protein